MVAKNVQGEKNFVPESGMALIQSLAYLGHPKAMGRDLQQVGSQGRDWCLV